MADMNVMNDEGLKLDVIFAWGYTSHYVVAIMLLLHSNRLHIWRIHVVSSTGISLSKDQIVVDQIYESRMNVMPWKCWTLLIRLLAWFVLYRVSIWDWDFISTRSCWHWSWANGKNCEDKSDQPLFCWFQ